MSTEDDLLKEAIAGTEHEIFSEAVGNDVNPEHGALGDRTVEEMGEGLEGQHEPEEAEVEAAGEGEGAEEGADGETGDGKEGEGADGERPRDPKTGQFVAKDKDGEEGGEGEAEGAEGDGKEGAQAATEQQPGSKQKPDRVPVGEVISERKARQTAETERDSFKQQLADATKKYNDDMAALNRRLDDVLAGRGIQQPQQQQPQPQQEQAPALRDVFEDQAGFAQDIVGQVLRGIEARNVQTSLEAAAETHGEKFTTAYAALTSLDKGDPMARATVQRIWKSRDPGAALMRWHEQEADRKALASETLAQRDERIKKEVRDALASDPEFLKQVAATLRGDAQRPAPGGDGKPRTVTRMPRSLNSASGGGQSNGVGRPAAVTAGSERDVFNDAMSG